MNDQSKTPRHQCTRAAIAEAEVERLRLLEGVAASAAWNEERWAVVRWLRGAAEAARAVGLNSALSMAEACDVQANLIEAGEHVKKRSTSAQPPEGT